MSAIVHELMSTRALHTLMNNSLNMDTRNSNTGICSIHLLVACLSCCQPGTLLQDRGCSLIALSAALLMLTTPHSRHRMPRIKEHSSANKHA